MMRIKEAIQRRRLIQQLNDEYAAIEDNDAKNSASTLLGPGGMTTLAAGHNTLAYILRKKRMLLHDADALGDDVTSCGNLTDHHRAYLRLHDFVNKLNQHLSDAQRRALRVTWKRLSEPPKTSGRGTLQIMEKIFEHVLRQSPEATSIFYRSAFIKCIEERRSGCPSGTIATIRDHAHLLIDLVDGIMCVMFDTPFHKPVWDPSTIGRAHAKYIPMGFDPNIWQKLGEYFAEVMFSQECVRAYPHAASAWSTLSVVVTDKMYSQTIRAKHADLIRPYGSHSTMLFNNQKYSLTKNSLISLLPTNNSIASNVALGSPYHVSHTGKPIIVMPTEQEPIPLHMTTPRKSKNRAGFSDAATLSTFGPQSADYNKSHRRRAFQTYKLTTLRDDSTPTVAITGCDVTARNSCSGSNHVIDYNMTPATKQLKSTVNPRRNSKFQTSRSFSRCGPSSNRPTCRSARSLANRISALAVSPLMSEQCRDSTDSYFNMLTS